MSEPTLATRPDLTPLLDLARSATDPEVDASELEVTREAVMLSLARARAIPKRRSLLPLLAAAAVLAITVVGVAQFLVPRDLTYAVVGQGEGSGLTGSYIHSEHGPTALRFSDGTLVVFERASRGRVTSISSRGADLVVDSGTISVDVHHQEGSRWSVAAGPFAVQVTGTRFDLSWSGAELNVKLYEGSVRVDGVSVAGSVALTAGHELVARDSSEVTIRPLAAVPDRTAPTQASAAPIEAFPSASAQVRPAPTTSWTDLVASGDFRAVVDHCERLGSEGALATRPLTDLVALAEAARYVGRSDLARRALLAQRERFSGSAAATQAAFFLGRMSEDSLGQPAEAINYYEQYLTAAPNGAFSSEALGRQMLLVHRLRGKEAGVVAAQAYLARFPAGAYAAAAQKIMNEP